MFCLGLDHFHLQRYSLVILHFPNSDFRGLHYFAQRFCYIISNFSNKFIFLRILHIILNINFLKKIIVV